MLTSPTGRDSRKLWPSLSSNGSSMKQNTSESFFGDDKKFIHVTGSKSMAQHDSTNDDNTVVVEDDDGSDSECKAAPVYKNDLSDALANALKSASLTATAVGNGSNNKKKKSKKTVLFSSGMNFN